MTIEQFATNPYVVVGSYVLAAAGVILAVVFYYKSKERIALRYFVSERVIVRPPGTGYFDLDLPVSRNGQVLSFLRRTYVRIQNVGNRLIEPKDIIGKPTIRVDADILEAAVFMSDDPGSQVSLSAGEREREIGFEFLRPKDAFVVRIDHTGNRDQLFIDCRTKVGGPIDRPDPSSAMLRGALFVIGMSVSCGALLLFLGPGGQKFIESSSYLERLGLVLVAVAVPISLLGMMSIFGGLIFFVVKELLVRKGFISKGRPSEVVWRQITES
jgi:hypothetical protein